jgi:hypothetical protein
MRQVERARGDVQDESEDDRRSVDENADRTEGMPRGDEAQAADDS